MSSEHEIVQEALAGYALHALDDDELSAMEALMSSHLPHCLECTRALESFQAVAGELGLAPDPRPAPRIMQSRIKREVESHRRPRWIAGAVASAAIVALAGIAFFGVRLTSRANDAETRQAKATEVLAAVSHPQSQLVNLSSDGDPSSFQVAATYVPGNPRLYLFGSMPDPHPNRVYQVWLVRSGQFSSGGTFVPHKGQVLVRIDKDASSYDNVLVTEEPERGSDHPSTERLGSGSLSPRG